MQKSIRFGSLAILSVAAAFGFNSTAQASLSGGLTVVAESSLGRATYTVSSDALVFNPGASSAWEDDVYTWELNRPVEMRDADGDLIARLLESRLEYVADPVVTLGFVAVAGVSATTFTFTSGLLSFPSLPGAIGQVSVGTSVTDVDSDGATYTSTYTDGNSYRAFFNGGASGGSLFSSQIASDTVAPNGTDVQNAVDGFRPVGGSVFDMQAQFSFRLSANDMASGTSRYEVVVPEPASMAALAVGALALIRRRARK